MTKLGVVRRLRTVVFLLWKYRLMSTTVLAAMLFSGIAGGAGLLTILPLLEISIGEGSVKSPFSQYYSSLLNTVGLSPTIEITLILIVIFICAKSILHLIAMDYVGRVVSQMASDLRIRLMRAITTASWNFFISNSIGKFTNAVTTHPQEASSTYRASCQLVAGVLETFILVAASLLISPIATIGGVLFGVLVVTLLARFVVISRKAGSQNFTAMEALSDQLADLLHGIKPLKAMNCERQLTPILEHNSEEINLATRRQVFAKYGLSTMREPLASIVLALGLYLSLRYAQIGIPELITTAILFHRISVAIGSIQASYQLIGSSERYYLGLEELMNNALQNTEILNSCKPKPPSSWNTIEVAGLSFDYSGKMVLNEISLKIQKNSLTTITGPSGSGKTTLIDILCGITLPKRGNILIDSESLSEIDIGAWRQKIGYVPQELSLLHDTVFNNVSLRDPNVSRQDVEIALQAAGAWEFVATLVGGMDAMVGERGLMLSGGQRQRIAIARALVRSPNLLILDEATTALDLITEMEVIKTIQILSNHITVVAVSHQPGLVAVADQVLILENGKIRQSQPKFDETL